MYTPSRDKDIIVRLFRAARSRNIESGAGERRTQVFDAVLYSHLPSLGQGVTDGKYPGELRGLPLAGIERLTLRLGDSESYLAMFLQEEKGMAEMRSRLLETMSPLLRKLMTEPPVEVRIWWSSATPELEEYPWELTAGDGEPSSQPRVAFLRGLPSQTPIPALPVEGMPKLAVLGTPAFWPDWAMRLKQEFAGQVTAIDLPLREALQEAVRARFELVHLFSDGIVSGALEGILYDHDERRSQAELPAGDISRILSGSRIAVMGLATAETPSPDGMIMAGRLVLSAYRAFAYLGASTSHPLPSMLAPLGPIPMHLASIFWEGFYTELIRAGHLTGALRSAQKPLPFPLPIALFCRHAGGRLFLRSTGASPVFTEKPMQAREDLIRSEHLTSAFASLREKYSDLPESVTRLLEGESERQNRLRVELETPSDGEDAL